jgi:hypothetical protein
MLDGQPNSSNYAGGNSRNDIFYSFETKRTLDPGVLKRFRRLHL